MRLELLNDVRQRNSVSLVREKMSKTFSYRRQEVVQGSPGAAEFIAKWPALFHIDVVNVLFLTTLCFFITAETLIVTR